MVIVRQDASACRGVKRVECDGSRSNTSSENSQLWITKQAYVAGAITVLLDHGASMLLVARGWPPVTLDGANCGDHVMGGEAWKAALRCERG